MTSPYAQPDPNADSRGQGSGRAPGYGGSAQQYGAPGGSAQPYAPPGGPAQQYGVPDGSSQPHAASGGSAQQYGAPGQGGGVYQYQRDDTAPIPLTADSIVMPSATGAAWLAFVLAVPFILGSIWNVIYLGGKGTVLGIVVLGIFGAFLLFGGFLFRSSSMTIDATGFHAKNMVRSADIPWPASRTGFYVRVERKRRGASSLVSEASVRVITPDGRAMPLTGAAWAGIDVAEMEVKGITQCWRLWNWAVAKGFTRETGQYVELSGLGIQQAMRSKQEHLYGIVRG